MINKIDTLLVRSFMKRQKKTQNQNEKGGITLDMMEIKRLSETIMNNYKKTNRRPGAVAHICNPSTLGG